MTNPANSADPTVFGPIFWKSIHDKARNAQSPEHQKQFIVYFHKKIQSIPCETCRTRALEYIRENPIEKAPPARGPYGAEATMFRYTWEFHNLVNSHLDKPLMTWEKACSSTPITGHLDLSEPLAPSALPKTPSALTPPSNPSPSNPLPSSPPKTGCPCQHSNQNPLNPSNPPNLPNSPSPNTKPDKPRKSKSKHKHKHEHKHNWLYY